MRYLVLAAVVVVAAILLLRGSRRSRRVVQQRRLSILTFNSIPTVWTSASAWTTVKPEPEPDDDSYRFN